MLYISEMVRDTVHSFNGILIATYIPAGTQTFSKDFKTFKIAFRIGSEYPFIERLVLVKRFS